MVTELCFFFLIYHRSYIKWRSSVLVPNYLWFQIGTFRKNPNSAKTIIFWIHLTYGTWQLTKSDITGVTDIRREISTHFGGCKMFNLSKINVFPMFFHRHLTDPNIIYKTRFLWDNILVKDDKQFVNDNVLVLTFCFAEFNMSSSLFAAMFFKNISKSKIIAQFFLFLYFVQFRIQYLCCLVVKHCH